MLALVIPIEPPVHASQLPSPGTPTQLPADPNQPSHKPSPPSSGGERPSNPIFYPGQPENGLPPILAFPSNELPGGAHASNELPKDPRRPHVGGGPADKPPHASTQPLPGGAHASQLPAGIRIVKPPIYIEGNPPLIGWELPETPSTKPSPKPPEEATPKK